MADVRARYFRSRKSRVRCVRSPYTDPTRDIQSKTDRRKEEGTLWENICEILSEYTENCSLHGLRYIGSRQSTHVERVFWAVAFLASLLSVSYTVTLVWDKWNRNPVIVSFKNTISPIWEVPFPAVTICNDNPVNMSFLMDYHEASEQLEFLSYAAILCPFVNDTRNLELLNETKLREFITAVSPSCGDTMDTYTWMGGLRAACGDFKPIVTVAGLCFSFNMLPLHQILKPNVYLGLNMSTTYEDTTYDWTPENQFNSSAGGDDSRPRRAMGGGIMYGLELSLAQNHEEISRRCSGPHAGFKVSLHSPAEVPRPDKTFSRVGPNTEVVFAVQPKVFTTSSKLAKIDPRKRSCYFKDEKPLQFFRIYTQRNCKLECMSNYTLQECHCIMFYMPHFENTPFCGKEKQKCVTVVRSKLQQVKMRPMKSLYSNFGAGDITDGCGLANQITTHSRVIIFFKHDQFVSIFRDELYGIVDFISNCGGLLSLFLGFGLLSFVEIFYFLTIRPIFGRAPEKAEAPPEDLRTENKESVLKYASLPPVVANKKGANQWRTVVY